MQPKGRAAAAQTCSAISFLILAITKPTSLAPARTRCRLQFLLKRVLGVCIGAHKDLGAQYIANIAPPLQTIVASHCVVSILRDRADMT